jgi:hypothetical protein
LPGFGRCWRDGDARRRREGGSCDGESWRRRVGPAISIEPIGDAAIGGHDPLTLPEYDVEQYVVPLLAVLPDGSTKLHGTALFITGSGAF